MAAAPQGNPPGSFTAVSPRTGAPVGAEYLDATPDEVAAAVADAVAAGRWLRDATPAALAALLEAIAAALEADAEPLIAVADGETGLGTTRLTGELARTAFQLRSFAEVVARGGQLGIVLDTADPDAVPIPRPDLRRMLVPVGPVAVFGAVNFPLAFGVCGGDTASALAAGCPVVVKGHPSHPGTNERCAAAVALALVSVGAPSGVLTLVQGAGHAVGAALVQAPAIRAVGFTGSQAGGRALLDLAAARPDPIPVHAEMGSTNPLFVTSAALAARGAEIATGLAGSVALGTGQFCTKPGLVLVPEGPDTEGFVAALAAALDDQAAGLMLDARLGAALHARIATTAAAAGVRRRTRSGPVDAIEAVDGALAQPAVLFDTTLAAVLADPSLREEHFGPVAIVVRCGSDAELVDAARTFDGNLTATVHAEPADAELAVELASVLAERVGRLVWNGFPTGVAVAPAMQHGGPWPASSSGHTSVGTTAVRRFQRPVAYQSAPAWALPPALRDDDPWGVRR